VTTIKLGLSLLCRAACFVTYITAASELDSFACGRKIYELPAETCGIQPDDGLTTWK